MCADRDPVEELLDAVSDGKPINWNTAVHGLDPGLRVRVDALRDVSRIAEFNRGLQEQTSGAPMPERWGDLLLLERIGSGAHAEVFRAWDPALRREVALKLLRSDADEARLLEEGRAAARVRHAHVAAVHGIDVRDNRVGLWMELVRGPNLEQEVRARGPLAPDEAARLGNEVASALSAVHAAGLLHRDVKPANVVRDAEGRYVLTDFGLGVTREDAAREASSSAGTPMYMAPELLLGAVPTERSDVYALGLVLWFALAGRHPFAAASLAELSQIAARGPKPSLRELQPDAATVPLANIVERAIDPDPSQRFADAREMLGAIEGLGGVLAVRPGNAASTARIEPLRKALVMGGILVAVGLVALVVVRSIRPEGTDTARPTAPAVAPPLPGPYTVEASFLRRDQRGASRLQTGDRVKPGDRLSLEFRATRPTWVYVLNEDERGERYLLFPQPRFDAKNPLTPDSSHVLPGTVEGRENAWTVTSAGGREYLLVVAGPEAVPELEAELLRLPAPVPGRRIEYAKVGRATVERLRGVGGMSELPADTPAPARRAAVFDRFRALAGRESDVRGVWVRQIALENPTH